MARAGILTKLSGLFTSMLGRVVQDCPPEVAACENCQRADCGSAHWATCARRLAEQRVIAGAAQSTCAQPDEARRAATTGCGAK